MHLLQHSNGSLVLAGRDCMHDCSKHERMLQGVPVWQLHVKLLCFRQGRLLAASIATAKSITAGAATARAAAFITATLPYTIAAIAAVATAVTSSATARSDAGERPTGIHPAAKPVRRALLLVPDRWHPLPAGRAGKP